MRRWADAGWANSAVFAWGLLQGTIIPGLADIFFLPLALAQPSRAYRLAFAATAGTLISKDILVRTPAQIEAARRQPVGVMDEVIHHGVTVYER